LARRKHLTTKKIYQLISDFCQIPKKQLLIGTLAIKYVGKLYHFAGVDGVAERRQCSLGSKRLPDFQQVFSRIIAKSFAGVGFRSIKEILGKKDE
jgi:hypothetical protein